MHVRVALLVSSRKGGDGEKRKLKSLVFCVNWSRVRILAVLHTLLFLPLQKKRKLTSLSSHQDKTLSILVENVKMADQQK